MSDLFDSRQPVTQESLLQYVRLLAQLTETTYREALRKDAPTAGMIGDQLTLLLAEVKVLEEMSADEWRKLYQEILDSEERFKNRLARTRHDAETKAVARTLEPKVLMDSPAKTEQRMPPDLLVSFTVTLEVEDFALPWHGDVPPEPVAVQEELEKFLLARVGRLRQFFTQASVAVPRDVVVYSVVPEKELP